MLRKSDHNPICYKRVAEADGKEVPWNEIAKGYEYEKGKFVILQEEDFTRVDVEATQSVDILNFVTIDEVDPLLFHKLYYLEAGKGGDKAYVLLREALAKSGKIAIAKMVIRARQHLAAPKPKKRGLMLGLMRFPGELINVSEFKAPAEKSVSKAEMRMAEQLIESMTTAWKPEKYSNEYRDALENLIEKMIEHGDEDAPAPSRARRPSNVVDLVSILQESIRQTRGNEREEKPAKARSKPGKTPGKKAA
jgi:DNA end-binding protein Ku